MFSVLPGLQSFHFFSCCFAWHPLTEDIIMGPFVFWQIPTAQHSPSIRSFMFSVSNTGPRRKLSQKTSVTFPQDASLRYPTVLRYSPITHPFPRQRRLRKPPKRRTFQLTCIFWEQPAATAFSQITQNFYILFILCSAIQHTIRCSYKTHNGDDRAPAHYV